MGEPASAFDAFDAFADAINSGDCGLALEVVTTHTMQEPTSLCRGFVKAPTALASYLDYATVHPEDFATMICRCVEQTATWAEPSLAVLLAWAVKHPEYPRSALLLLDGKGGKYNVDSAKLARAREAGFDDPYYSGTKPAGVDYPNPDFPEDQGRYRGFRHAFHTTRYGDAAAKLQLWQRWHAKCGCFGPGKTARQALLAYEQCYVQDCSFDGCCLALGIVADRGYKTVRMVTSALLGSYY